MFRAKCDAEYDAMDGVVMGYRKPGMFKYR